MCELWLWLPGLVMPSEVPEWVSDSGSSSRSKVQQQKHNAWVQGHAIVGCKGAGWRGFDHGLGPTDTVSAKRQQAAGRWQRWLQLAGGCQTAHVGLMSTSARA